MTVAFIHVNRSATEMADGLDKRVDRNSKGPKKKKKKISNQSNLATAFGWTTNPT